MSVATTRGGAALLLCAGSATAGAALLGSAAGLVRAGVTTPDDAVAVGVHVVGLLVLAWYLLSGSVAGVCAAARVGGQAWAAGEHALAHHGAPLTRRLLVTGAGAAMAAAAVIAPAAAAPVDPPEPTPTVTDDLGWGAGQPTTPTDDADTDTDTATSTDAAPSVSPTSEPQTQPSTTPTTPAPDSTTSASSTPEDANADDEPTEAPDDAAASPGDDGDLDPASAPAGAAADTTDTTTREADDYTVAVGDSLWTIAATHLPDGATTSDIATAWPRWYAANESTIGPDADLIHPGQVLVAPDQLPEEES